MENRHKKIKGYRELNQDDIELINEVKKKAAEVEGLIEKINSTHMYTNVIDPRWLSIGKTNLQQGFMALVRSIARPDSF